MSPFHKIPLEERVLGPLILRQVERHGGRTYLSTEQGRWTYEEFLAEAQALAHGLQALGVRPQASVYVLMNNRAEFMVALWAVALLNAVIIPVNPAFRGDALRHVLQDGGGGVALVAGELLDNLFSLDEAGRRLVTHAITLGATPQAWPRQSDYDALVAAHRGLPLLCVAARFDDIHMVSYTSGTTGRAKGVQIPYSQGIQTSLTCIDAVGIRGDDVIYAPLPLFHGMSRTMGTIPALLLGAHAHVAPRFSASGFWEDVARVGATVAVTIFTIPPTLKNQPPSPQDRAHRLRVMFNAHHDREFEDRFGVQVVEAHGMTEVGITVYSPFPQRREGAAGQAAPDWEVRIVDEFDRPLPPGGTGEMVMRPRHPGIMMKGYLNQPEQTLAATRNLWFHSGDFMRMDEDGFFYFSGRSKERIRRRGENIAAFEIEAQVDQHPDVIESAAVAFPAGDGEDDVRIVAVRRTGSTVDEQALATWLEQRLPRFMWPRLVEFVPELPKTGSGKLEKYRIVESAPGPACWDRHAQAQEARP